MSRLISAFVLLAVTVVILLAKVPAISVAARSDMSLGLWLVVFFGFWWGLVVAGGAAYMVMGAYIGAYGRIDSSRMWAPRSRIGQWVQIAFIWLVALCGGFFGANFMLSGWQHHSFH